MSNVTMGVRPNINLYGKAAISCSVAIPSLAIYFYFCPSTEAKYGKDAGLLSNCGARDCHTAAVDEALQCKVMHAAWRLQLSGGLCKRGFNLMYLNLIVL